MAEKQNPASGGRGARDSAQPGGLNDASNSPKLDGAQEWRAPYGMPGQKAAFLAERKSWSQRQIKLAIKASQVAAPPSRRGRRRRGA